MVSDDADCRTCLTCFNFFLYAYYTDNAAAPRNAAVARNGIYCARISSFQFETKVRHAAAHNLGEKNIYIISLNTRSSETVTVLCKSLFSLNWQKKRKKPTSAPKLLLNLHNSTHAQREKKFATNFLQEAYGPPKT